MQRFLERATDRHRLADAFHPRRERRVRLWKFLEREPRHFHHAVIDGRLEAGRRLARDIVFDFIKGITDGEFCRDFRDGKTRRFGGQRART